MNNATNQVFTPPQDGYIRVTLAYNAYSVDTYQVELGSTATAYEPYVGTTYPIPLPSTVYGGTLDVSTGVMTVTHALKEISLTSSTVTRASTSASGKYRFNISVSMSDAKLPSATNQTCGALSNIGNEITEDNTYLVNANGFAMRNANLLIYYSDATSTMTVDDFIGAVGSTMQVVYPLSTPQTITLAPTTISTLLGNNTIYADAGQVSVAYRADVGLYIDKRIAEVQALVLES